MGPKTLTLQQSYDPNQVQEYIRLLKREQESSRNQAQQKKKTSGRGGFLSSLISEGGAAGGATLGATIGSAIPGIGTIIGGGIGGLIGGFTGKGIENKVRDDQNLFGEGGSFKSALGEGLLSGALSAAGAGFQAYKGAKAAKGLSGAINEAAGGADDVAKFAGNAARSQAQPGMLSKKGLDLTSKAGGYYARDNVPGIGKITTSKVKAYDDLLKKLKIPANDAGDIARNVENAKSALNKTITNTLEKANVKYSSKQMASLGDDIMAQVKKTPGATKDSIKYAQEQVDMLVKNTKDLKGIHDWRQLFDDSINWNANPDSATAQTQVVAKTIRNSLKNKIGADAKGIANVNNLYHNLTDIEKLALRASGKVAGESTSASGGIGARILTSPTANTLRAKSGRAMSNIGTYTKGTGGAASQLTNQATRQLPGNLLMAGMGTMNAPQPQSTDIQSMGGVEGGIAPGATIPNNPQGGQLDLSGLKGLSLSGAMGSPQPPQQYNPYAPENIQSSIAQIMQQGGDQGDIKDFLDIASSVGKIGGGSGKDLTSGSIGTLTDYDSGINDIQNLMEKMQGSSISSPIVGAIRGRNPFDTNAQQMQAEIDRVRQVVGKALEGGVLRKEDEEKYKKILPTLNDKPDVAMYKLQSVLQALQIKRDQFMSNYQQYGGASAGPEDFSSMIQNQYSPY